MPMDGLHRCGFLWAMRLRHHPLRKISTNCFSLPVTFIHTLTLSAETSSVSSLAKPDQNTHKQSACASLASQTVDPTNPSVDHFQYPMIPKMIHAGVGWVWFARLCLCLITLHIPQQQRAMQLICCCQSNYSSEYYGLRWIPES